MPERIDDLNRNGYRLIQDTERFRFGTDAVLLSGFTIVKKSEMALDLGCGTGVIPVLLCAKTGGSHFYGLEIDETLAGMARRSVSMNGLEDKISIHTGDIKHIQRIFTASSFDVVTANPPYYKRGGGAACEKAAAAKHETLLTLADVAAAAAWALRNGGRFYMVHRPERLAAIINTLTEHGFEIKTLRFVQAFAHTRPELTLIGAAYRGRPHLNVLPPLVIYKERGVYTDETHAIYYG